MGTAGHFFSFSGIFEKNIFKLKKLEGAAAAAKIEVGDATPSHQIQIVWVIVL